MKAIIIVIFALLTCAHGQQRAFWKFYSEADCQDDKIIGYAMEPVGNPETRASVACTNVQSAGQSFKMDVGVFTVDDLPPFRADWATIWHNSDDKRCAANDSVWNYIAAQVGICIRYTYSGGKPTVFLIASCSSSNPWEATDKGSILYYYNSDTQTCSNAYNFTYPFFLDQGPEQGACLQSSDTDEPTAIAGVCPPELVDVEPPVPDVPVAPVTVGAPVDAPVDAPTVPGSAPIKVPVAAPTASGSTLPCVQAGFVAALLAVLTI